MMHTKLFLGYRVSSDMKLRLAKAETELLQIVHEEKDYIGLYLEKKSPTLEELRKKIHSASRLLQELVPETKIDALSFVVFPQLFLG